MSKFLDSNTLTPAIALARTAIASDTDTTGAVIDTQGIRDVNILATIDTLTAGDILFVLETADDSGMSTNLETIAAADVDGDLYNEVVAFASLTADDIFQYHIHRTAHRRFVRLTVTSSNSADYAVSAMAALGYHSKSVAADKNPVQ